MSSLGKVEGQQSCKLAKAAQLLNETGGGGTGPPPHIAACTPEGWVLRNWPGNRKPRNRGLPKCVKPMFPVGHMANRGQIRNPYGGEHFLPEEWIELVRGSLYFGWVIAPCDAEETKAAYFANTPVG